MLGLGAGHQFRVGEQIDGCHGQCLRRHRHAFESDARPTTRHCLLEARARSRRGASRSGSAPQADLCGDVGPLVGVELGRIEDPGGLVAETPLPVGERVDGEMHEPDELHLLVLELLLREDDGIRSDVRWGRCRAGLERDEREERAEGELRGMERHGGYTSRAVGCLPERLACRCFCNGRRLGSPGAYLSRPVPLFVLRRGRHVC